MRLEDTSPWEDGACATFSVSRAAGSSIETPPFLVGNAHYGDRLILLLAYKHLRSAETRRAICTRVHRGRMMDHFETPGSHMLAGHVMCERTTLSSLQSMKSRLDLRVWHH